MYVRHGLVEGLGDPNVGKVHETWGVCLTEPLPVAAAGVLRQHHQAGAVLDGLALKIRHWARQPRAADLHGGRLVGWGATKMQRPQAHGEIRLQPEWGLLRSTRGRIGDRVQVKEARKMVGRYYLIHSNTIHMKSQELSLNNSEQQKRWNKTEMMGDHGHTTPARIPSSWAS